MANVTVSPWWQWCHWLLSEETIYNFKQVFSIPFVIIYQLLIVVGICCTDQIVYFHRRSLNIYLWISNHDFRHALHLKKKCTILMVLNESKKILFLFWLFCFTLFFYIFHIIFYLFICFILSLLSLLFLNIFLYFL